MKPELLSLLSFAVGMAAYSVSQLQQHGKLRWQVHKIPFEGFWGLNSDKSKYKMRTENKDPLGYDLIPMPEKALDTWYYRFFKLKYKERFPLSATFLVFLTDGYHLMQFLFFLFISLSVVPILGWTYGIAFWILAHVIHAILYRTLQR